MVRSSTHDIALLVAASATCAVKAVIAVVVHCERGLVYSCTVPDIISTQCYIHKFCISW